MQWTDETKSDYKLHLVQFFGWLSTSQYSHMILNNNELTETFEIDAFLAFLSQRKKIDKDTGQRVHLALSSLTKYGSALKYYLNKINRPLNHAQETKLSDFLKGFKRICAQEKQQGLRPIKEGKSAMPVRLYHSLAQYFYQQGDFESALYLILCWNIGCRTNNTADLKVTHISWNADAIKIEFGISKANQEGERDEWRLIFANPLKPVICPVVSLAIYLSTVSHRFSPEDRLFQGGDPSDRFQKALQKALKSEFLRDILIELGLKPSDIGAHSIRKGAATELANGSTCSPSYPSICLRFGWSLGVQDRYIHYNYAADAYCGRILTGLDQNSTFFSILPPHSPERIPFELTRNSFSSTMNVPSLEQVRQFMLCSLLHAADMLKTMLPTRSTVFSSYVFRNLTSLKEKISIISGISSPVLRATGLPPHVITWLYQNETRADLNALPDRLSETITNTLRENGVAAGNITREMMESMLRDLLATDRQNRNADLPPLPESQAEDQGRLSYLWRSDGMFHRLPEDYVFPDLTVLQGFLHWFEGNREQGIPAFRFLQMSDVPTSSKKRFSDIRCLISEMMNQLTSEEQMRLRRASSQELVIVAHRLISTLPKRPKKKQTKTSEWKVTTALKEVRFAKILADPTKKRVQRSPNPSSYPRAKKLRS